MSTDRQGNRGWLGMRTGSPAVADKAKQADGKQADGKHQLPPMSTAAQVLFDQHAIAREVQTRELAIKYAVSCAQHIALSADDIIKLARFFVEFVSEPGNGRQPTKTHL